MKEILHYRMFESNSYRSHPDHTALYEALEESMQRDNNDELHEKSAAWKTSDTREAPSSSSKQKPASPPPVDDNPIPNDMHLLESEDTGATYLPNIKTHPDWLKPLLEEEAPETPKLDWVIPPNDLSEIKNNQADALAKTKLLPLGGPPGQVTIQTQYFFNSDMEYLVSGNKERRHALSISKLKAAYYPDFGLEELVLSLWTESESAYDISLAYCISHRYGYTYLKEIVLCRADYKEYKISKADFKNLHLNDFKDMYLLHLQGKLKHLSGADKVTLSTAVNLWTGTSSSDNADRNDQKKMMRETEVHKFSDGTLARILEKLDYMVKDYKLFKFNPDMENRIWTEDDKRRSQELSS
uniref:Uncharacterized protein n=1 Tax=Tanacetum cinerariifolium TaxID=118510 RepID=A0A699IDZ6_TANCI|nr:hypothetical protein [Tanacetum cinerariifolium]